LHTLIAVALPLYLDLPVAVDLLLPDLILMLLLTSTLLHLLLSDLLLVLLLAGTLLHLLLSDLFHLLLTGTLLLHLPLADLVLLTSTLLHLLLSDLFLLLLSGTLLFLLLLLPDLLLLSLIVGRRSRRWRRPVRALHFSGLLLLFIVVAAAALRVRLETGCKENAGSEDRGDSHTSKISVVHNPSYSISNTPLDAATYPSNSKRRTKFELSANTGITGLVNGPGMPFSGNAHTI
jgi:hypothetical protein